MNTYETINLNDYVQTGEGGTSLTYTHKTRPTMAKLFNLANEAELAEREFLTARAVFEMGIPTPEPLRLVTDLGTDDKATIGEYTKRIMAYYAVRLPYMVDLQVQGRLPEEALQQLPKVIG